MKRHMKKVNRARPTSPGERRGISQDLISLQTISKVHDINKNGTDKEVEKCNLWLPHLYVCLVLDYLNKSHIM